MRSKTPASLGLAAALALLAFYGAVLTLLGGWPFTREQFAAYWPYILALAVGFGVQVALYVHLRRMVRGPCAHGKVIAVSGSASAAAMVSCCTHYLANLLPIVGAAGVRTIVAQFQVQLLWIGLVVSAAGIVWIGVKVAAATKAHARCAVTG
jgi:Cu+-exporting ATPase